MYRKNISERERERGQSGNNVDELCLSPRHGHYIMANAMESSLTGIGTEKNLEQLPNILKDKKEESGDNNNNNQTNNNKKNHKKDQQQGFFKDFFTQKLKKKSEGNSRTSSSLDSNNISRDDKEKSNKLNNIGTKDMTSTNTNTDANTNTTAKAQPSPSFFPQVTSISRRLNASSTSVSSQIAQPTKSMSQTSSSVQSQDSDLKSEIRETSTTKNSYYDKSSEIITRQRSSKKENRKNSTDEGGGGSTESSAINKNIALDLDMKDIQIVSTGKNRTELLLEGFWYNHSKRRLLAACFGAIFIIWIRITNAGLIDAANKCPGIFFKCMTEKDCQESLKCSEICLVPSSNNQMNLTCLVPCQSGLNTSTFTDFGDCMAARSKSTQPSVIDLPPNGTCATTLAETLIDKSFSIKKLVKQKYWYLVAGSSNLEAYDCQKNKWTEFTSEEYCSVGKQKTKDNKEEGVGFSRLDTFRKGSNPRYKIQEYFQGNITGIGFLQANSTQEVIGDIDGNRAKMHWTPYNNTGGYTATYYALQHTRDAVLLYYCAPFQDGMYDWTSIIIYSKKNKLNKRTKNKFRDKVAAMGLNIDNFHIVNHNNCTYPGL